MPTFGNKMSCQFSEKYKKGSTRIKQILRFYSLNNIRTKVLRKIKPKCSDRCQFMPISLFGAACLRDKPKKYMGRVMLNLEALKKQMFLFVICKCKPIF